MIKQLFEAMFKKDPNLAFNSLGSPTLPTYGDLIEGMETVHRLIQLVELNSPNLFSGYLKRFADNVDIHMKRPNYQTLSLDFKNRFENLKIYKNKKQEEAIGITRGRFINVVDRESSSCLIS